MSWMLEPGKRISISFVVGKDEVVEDVIAHLNRLNGVAISGLSIENVDGPSLRELVLSEVSAAADKMLTECKYPEVLATHLKKQQGNENDQP